MFFVAETKTSRPFCRAPLGPTRGRLYRQQPRRTHLETCSIIHWAWALAVALQEVGCEIHRQGRMGRFVPFEVRLCFVSTTPTIPPTHHDVPMNPLDKVSQEPWTTYIYIYISPRLRYVFPAQILVLPQICFALQVDYVHI